jgi:hypothetical protein
MKKGMLPGKDATMREIWDTTKNGYLQKGLWLIVAHSCKKFRKGSEKGKLVAKS